MKGAKIIIGLILVGLFFLNLFNPLGSAPQGDLKQKKNKVAKGNDDKTKPSLNKPSLKDPQKPNRKKTSSPKNSFSKKTVVRKKENKEVEPPQVLVENQFFINSLIEGESQALNEKLKDLSGYPVVINHWASWCSTCREEFGYFKLVTSKPYFADRVAFLGINSFDDVYKANSVLTSYQPGFVSIVDLKGESVKVFNKTLSPGLPITYLLNDLHNVVCTHIGSYVGYKELAQEIKRCLL